MGNKKEFSERHIKSIATQIASLDIEKINILADMVLNKAIEESNREIIFPLKVLMAVTRK